MLKPLLSLCILVTFSTSVLAQNNIKLIDASLSYIAPMAIRDPGLKLGLGVSFYQWTSQKKGSSKTFEHHLILEPQVAYFGSTNYYYSTLSNLDIGWKWQKLESRSHSRIALGLGLNNRSEVLTLSANFDGTSSVSERERRNYFIPTISYQWAYQTYKNMDLFTRASAGINFSSEHPNFKSLLIEFGVRYNFQKLESKTK